MGPNDWMVAQLWRYPIKSMQGERLPAVKVQAAGLDGDRRWGVRDERTGRVLTGRREARLLEATASLGEGAEPVIKLRDGTGLIGAGDRQCPERLAGAPRAPRRSCGARRSR